jgi:hypothetical protein
MKFTVETFETVPLAGREDIEYLGSHSETISETLFQFPTLEANLPASKHSAAKWLHELSLF